MGVNYYLHNDRVPNSPIHIGLSSMGWCFKLHGIPGVAMSLYEWRPLLKEGTILDETGKELTYLEMMDVILKRKGITPFGKKRFGENYTSEEDFCAKNDAIRGPKNLWRDGTTKKHGNRSTWDLVMGDFS